LKLMRINFMKDANATHISCLIVRSVLGEEGKSYQKLLEKYVKTNGVEWTVARLKACYTASLHLKNRDNDKAIACYRMVSIAYTSKGYPRDSVLALPMKRFVNSSRPQKLKAYAAVLRCYTLFTLKKASRAQCLKVQTSISEPQVFIGGEERVLKYAYDLLDRGLTALKLNEYKPRIRAEDFCLSKLSPFTATYSGRPVMKPLKSKGTVKGTLVKSKLHSQNSSAVSDRPFFKAVYSLMNSFYLPTALQRVVPCWEIRERQQALYKRELSEESYQKISAAGKIHIIQEGGCKARAVAIPNAWVQMGFYPLHREMANIERKFLADFSCVHDQRRGAIQVLKRLQTGSSCYSVDLSSATDRFPRQFQTHVLEQLGLHAYANALKDLCNQRWVFPQAQEFGIADVTYSAGQPMGLYGSFPLFNAVHVILVRGLVQYLEDSKGLKLETFEDGTAFKILGDDIVISDQRLCDRYRGLLSSCGVAVAPSKTFEGSVAEFAGFLMLQATTPTGFVGFRPYKFPKGGYISNPVNLLDALGIRVKRMGRKWTRLIQAYSLTVQERCLDLAPMYPTETHNQVGISGTLGIQSVVSLRDSILYCANLGNKEVYLKAESWYCQEPIVYDGFRERIDESKKIQVNNAKLPPTSRVTLKSGIPIKAKINKEVVLPPLSDQPEAYLDQVHGTARTSAVAKQDPLIKEGLVLQFAYEDQLAKSKDSETPTPEACEIKTDAVITTEEELIQALNARKRTTSCPNHSDNEDAVKNNDVSKENPVRPRPPRL